DLAQPEKTEARGDSQQEDPGRPRRDRPPVPLARVLPEQPQKERQQAGGREPERRAVDEEQRVEVHREGVEEEGIDAVDQRPAEDEACAGGASGRAPVRERSTW